MSITNVSEISEFVNQLSFDNENYKNDDKNKRLNLYVKSELLNDKRVLLLANNFNEQLKNEHGEMTDKEKMIKRQANGLIFDMETKRIICMSQNKIIELNTFSEVLDVVKNNDDNTQIEYCEDGTVLRLYNYNNVWRTATTRCVNAMNSCWNGKKDFDKMFWEVFDESLLRDMDTNYTYFFVLLHRENRIVIKHNVNMLVYVSRIHNVNYTEDNSDLFKDVYGIKRPKQMSIDEFVSLSKNVNNFEPKFKRGIIIKTFNNQNNTWNLYKYDFEKYKLVKEIRGNVADIRMRYLELLNKPESLDLLQEFYKEHHFMFTFIKASLLKLVKTIYKLYVDSHIKHTITVRDDNIFLRTLKQLHAQYNLTKNPISFFDVQKKVFSLNTRVIAKFLEWE